MPALSIVIPTRGRASLHHALASIYEQAGPEHVEILVVADTHAPLLSDASSLAGVFFARYLEHDAGHHGYGHPQLLHGYHAASAPWIAALGDDDLVTPGGISTILRVVERLETPAPVLFRVTMFPKPTRPIAGPETIWRTQTLEVGNVSAQSLVLPNVPSRFGSYPSTPTGDFTFIRASVDLWGGPETITWREEIVCELH